MRNVGVVVGLLIALAGAVWVAQGLNLSFAPRSFMTANREWVLYGGLTVLLGLIIATSSRRRR